MDDPDDLFAAGPQPAHNARRLSEPGRPSERLEPDNKLTRRGSDPGRGYSIFGLRQTLRPVTQQSMNSRSDGHRLSYAETSSATQSFVSMDSEPMNTPTGSAVALTIPSEEEVEAPSTREPIRHESPTRNNTVRAPQAGTQRTDPRQTANDQRTHSFASSISENSNAETPLDPADDIPQRRDKAGGPPRSNSSEEETPAPMEPSRRSTKVSATPTVVPAASKADEVYGTSAREHRPSHRSTGSNARADGIPETSAREPRPPRRSTGSSRAPTLPPKPSLESRREEAQPLDPHRSHTTARPRASSRGQAERPTEVPGSSATAHATAASTGGPPRVERPTHAHRSSTTAHPTEASTGGRPQDEKAPRTSTTARPTGASTSGSPRDEKPLPADAPRSSTTARPTEPSTGGRPQDEKAPRTSTTARPTGASTSGSPRDEKPLAADAPRSSTTARPNAPSTNGRHQDEKPAEAPRTSNPAPQRPTHPPTTSEMRQMDTKYVNMLLALDGIPPLYNILANFFTWILLAGFVLFPGTFTNLQEKNDLGGVGAAAVNVIKHVSLYVIAWVCTGIGAAGMGWLWYRWQANYIWLVNRIFMPGFLNSLAGVLSALANILGSQSATLSISSTSTIIVTSSIAGICGGLTAFYMFVLIRGLKKQHDAEVGKQRAGKHGEGYTDLTKKLF